MATGLRRIRCETRVALCVLAPDETFRVDASALQHKNAVSPYDGRTLTGTVRQTWLRGAPIDLAAAPRGRLLTPHAFRHLGLAVPQAAEAAQFTLFSGGDEG